MTRLLLLLSWLMMTMAKDDDDDTADDDDAELDEDDDAELDEDDDDAADEDDDDEMTAEEAAELRADLKRANREASRARRALKSNKRPKRKADPETTVAAREARVAVKELLADNGLPTSAAKLVNLSHLVLEDGELADPDDVLEMVRDELEELGLTAKPKRKDDDDEDDEPRTPGKKVRKSARKAPRDKASRKADSTKSVSQRLIEQAGLG
jgi:hypothetical protein